VGRRKVRAGGKKVAPSRGGVSKETKSSIHRTCNERGPIPSSYERGEKKLAESVGDWGGSSKKS